MKIDITSLDGDSAGSIELDDAIFGLEPREDLIARMVRYQLAKRRAGTHKTQEPRRDRAHRQENVQAEGHWLGAVTARRACRSSAAADAPSVRSCARMRMICRRRCARWR